MFSSRFSVAKGGFDRTYRASLAFVGYDCGGSPPGHSIRITSTSLSNRGASAVVAGVAVGAGASPLPAFRGAFLAAIATAAARVATSSASAELPARSMWSIVIATASLKYLRTRARAAAAD